MRIPVLMFDFGNVLGFFDYSTMFHHFGLKLGLSAQQFESMMNERGVAQLGSEFESGRLTAPEFARQVTELAGLEMSFEEFKVHWTDVFNLNEPVARLVAALKQRRYTLLLGSNTNVLHARFYRRRFEEALAPFDHFVFSYEIGELKPAQLSSKHAWTSSGHPRVPVSSSTISCPTSRARAPRAFRPCTIVTPRA